MTTAVRITGETLAGTPDLPLLVCGPGPGVSARELWAGVAARLEDRFHVVTWECDDDEVPDRAADLVDPVVQYIDGVCDERGEPAGAFHFAGCGRSDVGPALLARQPERVVAAVLCGVPAAGVDPTGIAAPVVAMAGVYDADVAISDVAALAHGAPEGRLVVLERAGGPAPLEAPEQVAAELARLAPAPGFATIAERTDAGMAVRRAVLGDAHVDRATAAATDLTREFQKFITDYAWGGIWTRPGLDRRARSMITLTALVARGHHEELAMHLRAARTNGLSLDEIRELLLQTAIYCGVPDANTAFRIARQTLEG
ncbi:hypothetical protein A2U19_09490 [Dietzia maris]|nr:hypothetical protein A2U19_09490 [Dietzia maris]